MKLYRTLNRGWVFYPYLRDGDRLADPRDPFLTPEEQVFRRDGSGAAVTDDPNHARPRGWRRERGVPEVAPEVAPDVDAFSFAEMRWEMREMRADITSLRSEVRAIEPRLEFMRLDFGGELRAIRSFLESYTRPSQSTVPSTPHTTGIDLERHPLGDIPSTSWGSEHDVSFSIANFDLDS